MTCQAESVFVAHPLSFEQLEERAALRKIIGELKEVHVSRFPSSMRLETSGKSEHGFVLWQNLLYVPSSSC